MLFFIGLSNDIGRLTGAGSTSASRSAALPGYPSYMATKRQIFVGGVPIGGGAPVVVQSMTLTKTHDVPATTAQIAALAERRLRHRAGRRAQARGRRGAAAIVRFSPIPVIADIHFNASLALKAIEAGVTAVRINPGNIGGPDKVAEVVEAAAARGPDADRRQLRLAPHSTCDALRARPTRPRRSSRPRSRRCALLEWPRLRRLQDLRQVEPRADDDPRLPHARRRVPYPLHLGVTEAGPP